LKRSGRVLVYKETLLPPSETFVVAQAAALTRYEYLLAGLERCAVSLPVEKALVLTDKPGLVAAQRAKLYRRLGWAPRFHQQARRFQPDLVHAHFASGGRSAMPLARALGVPLVVTLHGADITVRGAAERYRALSEQAAAFICVSNFIRDRALEAGLPEGKLRVHYIGIDRKLFVPAPGEIEPAGVLFVGRLVEKKGCEYLIRAMAEVQRLHPDARLTVVGDGPLRSALESLAKDLHVRCEFLGSLPAERVRALLPHAMIFCAPSVTAANGDSEGLPTVLAEAQCCGLPVVSTMHAGIPEIIEDGRNGFLVAERDVSALSEALQRLLGDRSLREAFHAAALNNVERRFDLKRQTALVEDMYDCLIAGESLATFPMSEYKSDAQTIAVSGEGRQ
jgi:glycosyltransferase involved in cell wall biosynthesis